MVMEMVARKVHLSSPLEVVPKDNDDDDDDDDDAFPVANGLSLPDALPKPSQDARGI